jgi:hypothetical protein
MTGLFSPRRSRLFLAFGALAASAACSENTTPPTDSSPGLLAVVVNSTGTSIDTQFSLQFNGGEVHAYVSGTQFTRELPASVYTLHISDVAPNCALLGADTVDVVLYAGQRADVRFDVACTAPPIGA